MLGLGVGVAVGIQFALESELVENLEMFYNVQATGNPCKLSIMARSLPARARSISPRYAAE
jgi:hypothetical protein